MTYLAWLLIGLVFVCLVLTGLLGYSTYLYVKEIKPAIEQKKLDTLVEQIAVDPWKIF